MFRYLAFIWDPASGQQTHASRVLRRQLKSSPSTWDESIKARGLAVYCTEVQAGSLEVQALAGHRGVLIGNLVRAGERHPDDDSPYERFIPNEETSRVIVESRGRWLVENAWGNYVAIVNDPVADITWVLKDPAGGLPCFSTSSGGVTILFSAITDCLALNLSRFTVNRRYVEARLVSGDLSQDLDALTEVTQIHRGECVEIDPRRAPALKSRRHYWHPQQFANAAQWMDSVSEAAARLRTTLHACTRTLAAQHYSALLRLSGGLDSSIILGCLRRTAVFPRLLSYTQYLPKAGTDPRPWARLAVQAAGCRHVECEVRAADIRLETLLHIAPSPEPMSTFMPLCVGGLEQRIAADTGATAVFTGDGGDCAFGALCIGEALPALIERRGLRPAMIRLASQSALALNRTTWAEIARGVRAWRSGRERISVTARNSENSTLVSRELLSESRRVRDPHPWMSMGEPLSWEVTSKLGMLLASPDLYAGTFSPEASSPQIVSPIYSQPVMELCLRIPADVLFADGRERGLARRAFAGDVPNEILDRTWKDRAGDFHAEVVHRHIPWLREKFLDGILVRERLLDRVALEQALSTAPSRQEVFPGELLRHLDTELWLRQWTPPS